MHVYWTGVAADLWRSGDKSLEWLLTGAGNGEGYAAGHAEKAQVLAMVKVLLPKADPKKADAANALAIAIAH